MAALTDRADTTFKLPATESAKHNLKGRVNLKVHCEDSLRHRGVLLLYRCLALSRSIEVARLSPGGGTETKLELEVMEPLALALFLRQLPGVTWVQEEVASYASGHGPTIHIGLDKNLFPEGDRPRRKLIKDAILAATTSGRNVQAS